MRILFLAHSFNSLTQRLYTELVAGPTAAEGAGHPPRHRPDDAARDPPQQITAVDRNLALSAVRGFRLQPPLYARMTLPSLPAAPVG